MLQVGFTAAVLYKAMTSSDPSVPNLPRPPTRPEEWECCGRGCCPCILDYYEDALARWEAAVRKLGVEPEDALAAMTKP